MSVSGGPLVLVVDDDERIRKVVRTLLEAEGVTVDEAGDAATAIARASAQPAPDLIMLDVVMPGRGGWDVLDDLKSHSRLRQIPVVMLTARSQHDDQFRGMAQGADGYLVKPFEPEILVQTVHRMLGERSEPER